LISSSEPLVAMWLCTKSTFNTQNLMDLKTALDEMFCNPLEITFISGTITSRLWCPSSIALQGLQNIVDKKKFSIGRFDIKKAVVRIPQPGGNLFNSGQRYAFKSCSTLCSALTIIEKNLPPSAPNAKEITYQKEYELSANLATRFLELRELKSGWAGEETIAPSHQLISLAEKFILHLQPEIEPEIGAVEDGSLDIVWSEFGIYTVLHEESFGVATVSPSAKCSDDVQTTEFKLKDQIDKVQFLCQTIQKIFH